MVNEIYLKKICIAIGEGFLESLKITVITM